MELSRQELEHEIKLKEDDLVAITQGLALIRDRVIFSEENPTQLLPLHEWGGARGLVEIGEVIAHNMEKVLEELKYALQSNEFVRRPFLRIVSAAPLKSVEEEGDDDPPPKVA